jgi:hypothetical protein
LCFLAQSAETKRKSAWNFPRAVRSSGASRFLRRIGRQKIRKRGRPPSRPSPYTNNSHRPGPIHLDFPCPTLRRTQNNEKQKARAALQPHRALRIQSRSVSASFNLQILGANERPDGGHPPNNSRRQSARCKHRRRPTSPPATRLHIRTRNRRIRSAACRAAAHGSDARRQSWRGSVPPESGGCPI